MPSLTLQAKVLAIGQLIKQLTGELPIVAYGEDFATITFTESQKVVLKAWLSDQIDNTLTAKPGDIRIDFNSILIPVVLKKVAPAAIGSGLLGYILGKFL